jgi:hypothetical protein
MNFGPQNCGAVPGRLPTTRCGEDGRRLLQFSQWVLIFEQSSIIDADRDGGRKLARLRRGCGAKNRCRTTIAERMVETLAELPFIGDQVVCLSHDQAPHAPGLAQAVETCRPSDRDRVVTTGPSRSQPARPEVWR